MPHCAEHHRLAQPQAEEGGGVYSGVQARDDARPEGGHHLGAEVPFGGGEVVVANPPPQCRAASTTSPPARSRPLCRPLKWARRGARLAATGAEIVVADMFDPSQVQAALSGVQRLYYVPPWHPHVLHSAVAFATAAHREGVEAAVGLSQWLAQPDHPSLATRHNWLIDRLFADLPGVAHVVVNPGFFADNYLRG